jgi:hypothetical protein
MSAIRIQPAARGIRLDGGQANIVTSMSEPVSQSLVRMVNSAN